MNNRIFITGTDTNVGKTYVAVELLQYLARRGFSTIGLKPVATGCQRQATELYNSDALALQQHATEPLPYERVNPIAFVEPVAPHIAAQKQNKSLDTDFILQTCSPALNHPADIVVIEGAGGWYLPLNHQQTMAEVVVQWQASVILTVGMRLGCLNHALLTCRAIRQSGVPLLGWIANCIDEQMPYLTENIATLRAMMDCAYLGLIPYNQSARFDDRLDTILKRNGNVCHQ
jgi:dethiobiotin synthetase